VPKPAATAPDRASLLAPIASESASKPAPTSTRVRLGLAGWIAVVGLANVVPGLAVGFGDFR